MSAFTYASKIYRRFTSTQYLAWAVIVLAVAAIFTIGFMLGRNSAAATMRDCSDNSVDLKDLNGGCGAITPEELIADLKDNDPSDLQTIFADGRVGLPASKYDDFAAHARMGKVTRDGKLVVDGQTVMTGVWTMGRTDLGGKQPTTIEIGGKTYYHSAPNDSFGEGIQSIPAMVLFDDNGVVQAAALGPCGNPVTKGKKITPKAECKELTKTAVEGKENTYSFTTKVDTKLAKVIKVDYYVDEGGGPVLFATEEKPETPVTREFTKDATVIAKVTVEFPGKKRKVVESELCKQQVTVKKKEVTEKPKPEQPKPQVLPAKVEEKPLPVTGPADAAAIFFGTSLAGTIGHRLYMVYRDKLRRK